MIPRLAVWMLSCAIAGCAHKSQPPSASVGALTVQLLKVPSQAHVNGKAVLAYELLVTNNSAETRELERIEVSAGAFGDITYEGDELKERLKLLSSVDAETLADLRQGLKAPPSQGERMIPPHTTGAVYLWLEAVDTTSPPAELMHTLHVRTPSGTESVQLKTSVVTRRPLVLGPPLESGPWIPFQSPSNNSPHRRTIMRIGGKYYLAQRFAIDWGRLGDDGKLVRSADLSRNDTFYGYGSRVLAVADGTVEAVRNDLEENPGEAVNRTLPVKLDTVAGNYVIVDLGDGHFALYAHLQPGSIKVSPGDRVTKGQVLALLGNSGNSSAPHLHFHICDSPAALTCEGLPFVMESFTAQAFAMEGETTDQATARVSGSPRRVDHQLIVEEAIVTFR